MLSDRAGRRECLPEPNPDTSILMGREHPPGSWIENHSSRHGRVSRTSTWKRKRSMYSHPSPHP
jgi:hypothetical protein